MILFTSSNIIEAKRSASASVLPSEYTLIIGSVFDLRRCTQPSAKSILTPSIVVTRSSENFSAIADKIASTSVSGVS